ncbi:MAG: DegT/DnrJ/EryC1/StrS family aminotransferase [Acidobacteriota bacterium]|nr:DegT/DnrJ/EryC1/StrS family aminotransferase [Acidobacteriota bacterium]
MATKASLRAIPLLDLARQYQPLREAIQAAVTGVMESQRFILGAGVEHFEQRFAEYCGTRFAVGCASGTDALELALMALEIGAGDEVLTVPFTFFATAGAIMSSGARPVFVDVDPGSFNLDIRQLDKALAEHPRVKAILPVHLYGGCADMGPIKARAAVRGIPVIEDAAQAVGAEWQGQRAGGLGTLGCFSFFPTKNLGGFGDGGMLTTNDEDLTRKLKALRIHGSFEKYVHQWPGMNSRLDALQAAVLDVKLDHLNDWNRARQRNAALYREALSSVAITPAAEPYQTNHVFNQFVIRCQRRDELRAFLAESGVGTEIYYPLPLHLQPALADFGYTAGDFPVSEQLAQEVLALPIFAELTEDEITTVAGLIREFYQRG